MRRYVALFLCSLPNAGAAPRPQTITGRLIAYSPPLTCMNGNGYWGVVIQTRRSKDRAEFVRVELSLPCDKTLDWISTESRTRKFRLIRHEGCDAVIESSVPFEPGGERFPLWKPVSGAEGVALPFGKNYSLLSLRRFPARAHDVTIVSRLDFE